MTDISHTTIASKRALPEQGIDVMLARRLALKCESSATAVRGWAGILHGRLSSSRPMSDVATSTAARIVEELLRSADEIRKSALALASVLESHVDAVPPAHSAASVVVPAQRQVS